MDSRGEGGGAAFERLKRALCAALVLKTPDFTKEFVLQMDALLSQQAEDGGNRPVAYLSKKLLPREQNYSIVEKDCLAIKLAVQVFRVSTSWADPSSSKRTTGHWIGLTS